MNMEIRDIEDMPVNIKYTYSQILSYITFNEGNYNQLNLGALYKIINKIKLPPEERIQLLNFIMKKQINFDQMLQNIDLDMYLNDQEKNIFRFSLMKDLIIIMNADYVETENEKRILKNIQEHFNISDEQLSFFREEYESDSYFFDDNISYSKFREITKKTISTASSLGIPLTAVYYGGTFRGLGLFGTISGLRALGMKRKTGKYSLAVGIGTSIALGVITYKTLEYILRVRKNEKTKLANLMRENIEALHEETKNALYEDIQYFSNHIVETKHKSEEDLEDNLRLINLLKSTVATLENTDAVII